LVLSASTDGPENLHIDPASNLDANAVSDAAAQLHATPDLNSASEPDGDTDCLRTDPGSGG
jgi:hypothetical protein